MNRRAFIAALGGVAAWPLVVDAQQPDRVRRLGALMPWPATDPIAQASMLAFAQSLEHIGSVEGKNIAIEWRFAANDPILFKTYAAELVNLSPNAILASTPPALEALRQQTRTIPIVFVLVTDPVGQGFVQSLSRPWWQHHWVRGRRRANHGKVAPTPQGGGAKGNAGRHNLQSGHRALLSVVHPRDRGRSQFLWDNREAFPSSRRRSHRGSDRSSGARAAGRSDLSAGQL